MTQNTIGLNVVPYIKHGVKCQSFITVTKNIYSWTY